MPDERARILSLLQQGKISAEQAATLLDALDEPQTTPGKTATTPSSQPPARLLRISIDAHEDDAQKPTKVRINVPLALARFAGRFLPQEARAELEGQHIDINALIEALADQLPAGPLVDIDADEGEGKTVRILIEVV